MPGRVVITLPTPSLVVLVGAAGSGKSTLAARLFAKDAILSSDVFRAIVSGHEADQRATRAAFAMLHRELERRMAARRTTVVDATNVTPFARRGLIRSATSHDIPVVAIVLDLGLGVALERNARRIDRVVPETAVRRQLADLARSLLPGTLETEGFTTIHVVRDTAQLESLELAGIPG